MSFGSYRQLFALVAARPRMYVARDDFATLVAYVEGCHQGSARTLLTGFREWLVTQAGCGDNLVWWSLVLKIALPDSAEDAGNLSPDANAAAKQVMFQLLDEFLELCDERDGLSRIFAAHQQCLAGRTSNGCVASGQPSCPAVAWPRPRSQISDPT